MRYLSLAFFLVACVGTTEPGPQPDAGLDASSTSMWRACASYPACFNETCTVALLPECDRLKCTGDECTCRLDNGETIHCTR